MQSHKNIEIFPYDPKWSIHYENEACAIKEVLGKNLIAIHHVGSTSIPGMKSKPKIDLLAIVHNAKETILPLEKINYEYRGEFNIPRQYCFRSNRPIRANLHIFQEGSPEIKLNLTFRDYMRTHPSAREAYSNLKETLLADPASHYVDETSQMRIYTLKKGLFIRQILQEAGFNDLRILKCSDIVEWNTAKSFRDRYIFTNPEIKDPYKWTFNHRDHRHVVFYRGTLIIGYAHIQLWPNNRAALRIIAIEENLRGQKLGSHFLKYCEEWLKNDLLCLSLHLESRKSSLSFYQKNGYREMPFNDPEGHATCEENIAVGKIL